MEFARARTHARPLSLFEKPATGSTGDPPVPSGDPPDGTRRAYRSKSYMHFVAGAAPIPVGESPTGAGESPALPIFQTGFQSQFLGIHESRGPGKTVQSPSLTIKNTP